jgi:hypothetical protein
MYLRAEEYDNIKEVFKLTGTVRMGRRTPE